MKKELHKLTTEIADKLKIKIEKKNLPNLEKQVRMILFKMAEELLSPEEASNWALKILNAQELNIKNCYIAKTLELIARANTN